MKLRYPDMRSGVPAAHRLYPGPDGGYFQGTADLRISGRKLSLCLIT
jgi:hypothetical protein